MLRRSKRPTSSPYARASVAARGKGRSRTSIPPVPAAESLPATAVLDQSDPTPTSGSPSSTLSQPNLAVSSPAPTVQSTQTGTTLSGIYANSEVPPPEPIDSITSNLGMHLSDSIKEKIWLKQYVDFEKII